MHGEHEPTATDVCFEDVAVLMPKIAGEVKEPPASNAAGEGNRTHSGRMHYQAPFPQCGSEYPRRARRSIALTHTHVLACTHWRWSIVEPGRSRERRMLTSIAGNPSSSPVRARASARASRGSSPGTAEGHDRRAAPRRGESCGEGTRR